MHERAEECNIAHNASQNKERLKKTLDKVSKTREETAQIDEAVMRTRSEISEVEKSIGETEKSRGNWQAHKKTMNDGTLRKTRPRYES